jgi:hypothetical protein
MRSASARAWRSSGSPWLLDPDFAALEKLVLPDRRDLLDPLDRVAAGGIRVAAMRRPRRNRDARFADLEPPDPVCSASRALGQRPAISAAIRSNAFSASGS